MRLYQDAEADRKTRKQAKFSQLYRYLNMLSLNASEARDGFRDHMIPVVEDARHTVISVPPLSNCNQTRVGYFCFPWKFFPAVYYRHWLLN